jgi:hypothetical protein
VSAAVAPPGTAVNACTCHRQGSLHARLVDLLGVQSGGGKQRCRWELAKVDPAAQLVLDEVACVLADGAMQWRCRGAQANYELWRDAVLAGRSLSGDDYKKVVPFVRTVFGQPGSPPPPDHLCGWVAEFLWFRLAKESDSRPGGSLKRLVGPDFHATAPGGDGLAVWERDADRSLTFCLWEIKNHVGGSALTATIRRAYHQLHERAPEYLAKLTSVAAAANDVPEMRQLYGDLVNLWVDGSDRSGAGVAVGTHSALVPGRSFTTMDTYFPSLQGDMQLQGLIAAVARFDDLALDVRRRVWIAL